MSANLLNMHTQQPNPTTEPLNTLRAKLREMFHFAQNELDFGIFRILKLKRDEVNRFIDDELTNIVENALADVTDTLWESQLGELKEFVKEEGGATEHDYLNDIAANSQQLINFLSYKQREDLGAPLESNPGALKEKLAAGVYNHIHNFFERYYRDGDFGYNDRSTTLYQVDYPDEADYTGTDILFHWKCRDSYYVKTATGFNSIAFEIEGKRIEYRLEGKPTHGIAQNNNRDDFKHYRLGRIEPPQPDDTEPTWGVVLHLAETSTPKAELYREMNAQIFGEPEDVDIYLYAYSRKSAEPGKPIFKELQDNSTNVQSGQIRGIRALRMSLEEYAKKLVEHPDFRELGRNKTLRQEALQTRPTVHRFYAFDKNLNRFFVGMDSDYFIHKDLGEFLFTEQRRYIQNSILGDLDTLLNLSPENPTFAVAKAFRSVTDEVIKLLVTVETFQKSLFLMKKKVFTTDYLISLGKIAEATKNDTAQRETLISQILCNDAQLAEWRDTFGVDITEQLPLLEGLYPTLPLDTQHFDADFADRVLALFDNLEVETTGVLLHSDNFQALNLLMEKYRDAITAIYIDPPYNTGTDEFVYKDAFRHSSWLSLMYDRLLLSRELAQQNSAIGISINEEELFNLKLLLDTAMGSSNYLTTITVKLRHDDRILKGYKDIHEVTEQLLIYRNSHDFTPAKRVVDNTSNDDYCWQVTEIVSPKQTLTLGGKEVTVFEPDEFSIERVAPSEENLKRMNIRGSLRRGNSAGEFYTNYLEPMFNEYRGHLFKVPNMGNDGLGYRYLYIPGKDEKRKNGDYFQGVPIDRPDTKENPYPNHWRAEAGYWDMEPVFNRVGYEGAVTFRSGKKPLEFVTKYLVLAGVQDDTSAICLDFFAGSGTTGHAVLRLNKTDNGNRKFILVEMGDYFESTLKERIRRAMFSENWRDGKPNPKQEIDGTVGIVKYQRLEQYEDVLNNLTLTPPPPSKFSNPVNNSDLTQRDVQSRVPIKYLYRPEEQQIRLMLDLRAPFSNRITYGKDSTEGVVDIVESYCYLKGLPIERRLRFDLAVGETSGPDSARTYSVVKSGQRLVVFRNVTDETDDTAQLLEILANPRLAGVRQLDVNYDADQDALRQHPDLREVYLITTVDFDTGTVWEDTSL